MVDLLIILVVASIVLAVSLYIRKEKKRGVQCIGCPDAKICSGCCSGCAGSCHSKMEDATL